MGTDGSAVSNSLLTQRIPYGTTVANLLVCGMKPELVLMDHSSYVPFLL